MHEILAIVGVVLVIIIVVHIVFRIIKFTMLVLVLGVGLVAVLYGFQEYLGIDLIAIIANHI